MKKPKTFLVEWNTSFRENSVVTNQSPTNESRRSNMRLFTTQFISFAVTNILGTS